jgi:hypothetical protein
VYRDTFFPSEFITSSAFFAFASASADDSQLELRLVAQPLRAVAARALEQVGDVDDDVLGGNRDRRASRLFEPETHHRFIHRADLLDVQRAI